jgi:hypothetical protein
MCKDRWEVRQDILARTIRLKNPDLIGTQERLYIQGSIGGFGGRTTGRRIDWILFSGPFTVLQHETITYNEDGRCPSEHFPVIAVLEY